MALDKCFIIIKIIIIIIIIIIIYYSNAITGWSVNYDHHCEVLFTQASIKIVLNVHSYKYHYSVHKLQ